MQNANCKSAGRARRDSGLSSFRNFHFLILLLLAGTARAAEYFVATNGLDTNTGTNGWGDAKLTIAAAHTAASIGDTITVSNGTYNITAQISVSKAVTIRSFGNGVYGGLANAANTIVRRSSGGIRIFNVTTTNVVIDGLTIRDGNVTGNGGGVNMGANPGYVTLTNCVIRNNYASGQGGGIYARAATIVNCPIYGNTSGSDGGGIFAHYDAGGVNVIQCLIVRNTAGATGGGLYLWGNYAESCTIAENTAATYGGGLYKMNHYSSIYNCIVYNNMSSGQSSYANSYNGENDTVSWTYNLSTNQTVGGAGCISGGAPLFQNTTEGNYKLSAGSPCIDKGSNVTWMAGATDLAGNTRQQDGDNNGSTIVDMGAYEYGALDCDFVGSPRTLVDSPSTYQCFGPAPFTVQFTGSTYGTNVSGVVYRWDFEGTGSWTDWSSANTASYTYSTAGVYSPKLQVSNAVAQVARAAKSSYVSAGTTHYVVTNNPNAAYPYTTWATAASNSIQAAVNAAADKAALLNALGCQVIVSNGTYAITTQITNYAPVTVRSIGGTLSDTASTIVRRGSGTTRIFTLYHTWAVVQGLTIQEGAPNTDGGGVYLYGGTVANCVISNNTANGSGGGVYGRGGSLLNCRVCKNTASSDGGGIYAHYDYGGVTVRNCLIDQNTSTGTGRGGGLFAWGCTAENCTIAGNSASDKGGGLYKFNELSTVRNCIVYGNTSSGQPSYANTSRNMQWAWGTADWIYTCTTNEVVSLAGCNSGDPGFKNAGAGDYTLQAGSPCIDTGTNQDWMAEAKDLAGITRKQYAGVAGSKENPIVDMGAYETFVPPKGTVLLVW